MAFINETSSATFLFRFLKGFNCWKDNLSPRHHDDKDESASTSHYVVLKIFNNLICDIAWLLQLINIQALIQINFPFFIIFRRKSQSLIILLFKIESENMWEFFKSILVRQCKYIRVGLTEILTKYLLGKINKFGSQK